MNFIQLTYYKPEKNYGPTSSGTTTKQFFINPSHIVRLTEYRSSTKISLLGKEDIEVCESISDIAKKLNSLSTLPVSY